MKELRLTAKAGKHGVIYDLPAQVGAVAAWLVAERGSGMNAREEGEAWRLKSKRP